MGTMFEELVRRFNEEAGEHWTPRDAVRLMANLIFLPVADQVQSATYSSTMAHVEPAACSRLPRRR
jgi:type I restriction enzyme M protein